MSDTDLLREAAEVLDKRNWFLGDDSDPEWATTAALLRAVADARDTSNATPWGTGERAVRGALSSV